MWRYVTAVSTLEEDLTIIVNVSLRKYSCRFKKFQEYPRFCEHLGYS